MSNTQNRLPELRFTDDKGDSYPEWREYCLGDVFTWVNTNNLSREALTDVPTSVQNIHYGDIHSKFKSQFYQNRETVPYIKNEFINPNLDDNQYCQSE